MSAFAAEVVSREPRCAVAIYAHPDDAEVSCGGTLAKWAAAGTDVHAVICARGDKGSTDPQVKPSELVRRRSREVAAAGKVLGLRDQHLLGHPDGTVENTPALRKELVRLIRSVRPEVVVCPDPTAVFFGQSYFNHRDHREVGWATLDAVSPAVANPHYFPDAGPPHTVEVVYLSGTLAPDAWVDISATIDAKAEALLCHRSQLGETSEWLRTAVRDRAEEAGRTAGVAYAEGFRRLVLSGA